MTQLLPFKTISLSNNTPSHSHQQAHHHHHHHHHRSNSNPNPNSIREIKKEQDRKVLISRWQNGLIINQSNSTLRKSKSFNLQSNQSSTTTTKKIDVTSSEDAMVYSNDHVNRLSTFTENGSSIDDLSSNSIQSTLNTSITSSQPKSTYQPRPLLLSSFNHQYNKSNLSSSSDHSTSKFKKHITNLERRQLERHQDEILQEFKQKQKQRKLNELSNLSSKINPSYQNPDDDHWDWLSSDSDHQVQDDEKDDDDDDDTEESMAVVWRASLDVGRKVSKNRKALGKSSVLKKSSNSIHSSNPNPNSNQIKSQVLNHSIKLNKTQSILFNSISLLKSYIFNHHPSSTNSPWNHSTKLILFGSGLLAGVFSSTFSSLILGSHSLQRSHLGFFINFLFPSDLTLPNNLIGWSTPHLIRLTGIGIYYHC